MTTVFTGTSICRASRRVAGVACVLILAGSAGAQGTNSVSAPTAYDSSLFAALKWREIGPYRGGRSVAVAGSSSRPLEYYMGTTGGGVFKTTDGGITWSPITDKYFGGTIGAIAVSESNPDVVYVGTGEYPIRGNVSHGDGVFKSTDAGKTWSFVGLADTRQISRVRVSPRNSNIVYVGAQGHVWAPNADRGVFKSTDGGKNWKKILFRNDSTGISDLILDPSNPDVIYAAFWQAGRTPWQLVSGGEGSGIFKSTDGGEHWTELTRNPGLPKGLLGNIGLTVSPANPQRVWAIIEADSGGVYRSDNGGKTWQRTNEERKLRQRAWYYTKIFADPKDTNVVYVLNLGVYRSMDGGKTFKNVPAPHGDTHDLWIAPNDPQRMIESNDGGGNVSFDRGKSWSEQDFATAQFYHVEVTNDFPYKVCGAQQDNSTVCGPSRQVGGIDISSWKDAGGGESGYIAVRPDNPDIVFAGSYGGYITRKDMRTGEERDINPWPDNPMGHSAGDLKYRFQWTFPIVISPHDPNTIYVGSNVLFRSTNEGLSWTAISPDLTRNDPKTLGPSGGPITKDQTSVEYYGTIFTIAESPVAKGTIWTGSDDGRVQVTRDNGKTWTDATPKDAPQWTRMSIIEPSHYDAGVAYVAGNRYQLDDLAPYLWKTTDYGKSWTKIVDGIPATEFTRVIREDPVRRGLLFAGTERGLHVSFDDGAHWQSLRRGLPIVPVHDLAIKEGDLVAATHGRSFWILDDISALRQLTPQVAGAPWHLFKPRDPVRADFDGGFDVGSAHPQGTNGPNGASVYYTLAKANQDVTLEFLDDKGTVIQKYTSVLDSIGKADSVRADSVKAARLDSLKRAGAALPDTAEQEAKAEESFTDDDDKPRRAPRPPRVANKVGLNTFTWKLRYPDATFFNNLIMWAGSTRGPIAPPGTYAVRMTVGGQSQTERFQLKPDPRSTASPQDLQEQFAFLIKVRDRVSQSNEAVRTIRNVKHQLAERAKAVPGISGDAKALAARLSSIEEQIYQTRNRASEDPLNYPIRLNNKIAALGSSVASGNGRPTAQAQQVFNQLSSQLDEQLTKLKAELDGGLSKVNAQLKGANQPVIVPGLQEFEEKEEVGVAAVVKK
jgi:photosystem II stability/assembly factor-like uncharacterized protein